VNSPAVEFRSYSGPEGRVEIREGSSGRKIGGYAAKFNVLSRNLGGFVERISPGAFNKSRGDGWPEVMARYDHDRQMLLGTTGGGTLELTIDRTGLFYDVVVPHTRDDVLELVARNDVRHSSFAFLTGNAVDDWSTSDGGYPLRTLLSVQLVDVAPTAQPAYPDATAGLRSLARHFDADIEEVKAMAERDELRRLFPTRLDGRAAKTILLSSGPDPWAAVA
jgi:uncharacterized protein